MISCWFPFIMDVFFCMLPVVGTKVVVYMGNVH